MSTTTTTARAKVAASTTPTIYNLDLVTAGTEYSQDLTKGTKKILVRMRNRTRCKIAFELNGTTSSWITLEPGAVFFEENLDLTDATIYLNSAGSGEVAEILQWT